MGKLIPAGTGLAEYNVLDVESDEQLGEIDVSEVDVA